MTLTSLPPLDERQRYTIDESKEYLRCSRAHLYNKIAGKTVSTIKDGKRTYIPGTEIIRLSSLP